MAWRHTRLLARIGGEELAILGRADELPEALAAGLLHDVRTARMPHGGTVTVSLGIAEGPVHSEGDWRDLFQRADRALYEVKRDGRNRAVQAEALRDAA